MVFALISYPSPAFALISDSFSPSVFPFFRQPLPLCLLVSPYKSTFLLGSFPLCVLLSLSSSLLLPHSLVFSVILPVLLGAPFNLSLPLSLPPLFPLSFSASLRLTKLLRIVSVKKININHPSVFFYPIHSEYF